MEKKLKFALNIFFWWAIIAMYVWSARDFGRVPAYMALLLRLILQLFSFTLIFNKNVSIKRGFVYKLLIVWMIYTTIITLMNPHAPRELSENLWWPCIFILFYHFAAYPKLIQRFVNNLLPKLFIASFLFFSLTYTTSSYDGMRSTNYVFFITLLFPFLFFLSEKKRLLYYAIGLVLAILSFKRSGMLVAIGAGLVITWYDFLKAKGHNSGTKKILSVFFMLSMVGLYLVVDNYTGGHMSGRFESLEDDGGSGRDVIFEYVLFRFSRLDSFDQFFGIGFNGVMNHHWYELAPDVFISAHNDFLEVLCDFGYIGSILYVLFIINVVLNAKRINKYSNKTYKANVLSIFIFIISSMVSHLVLYPTYYAFMVALWGMTACYIVNGQKINEVLPRL